MVQLYSYTDEDNDSDGDDNQDDTVQQLTDSDGGGKALGRPDQHKSDKEYNTFR